MFHGFLGLFFYPLSFFSLSLVSMMAAATLHLNLKTNLRALTAKSQRRRNISYSSSSSFPKYKWIFVIFFFSTLYPLVSLLYFPIFCCSAANLLLPLDSRLSPPHSLFFLSFCSFSFYVRITLVSCVHICLYISGDRFQGIRRREWVGECGVVMIN